MNQTFFPFTCTQLKGHIESSFLVWIILYSIFDVNPTSPWRPFCNPSAGSMLICFCLLLSFVLFLIIDCRLYYQQTNLDESDMFMEGAGHIWRHLAFRSMSWL
jgi:hypothetical protein